MRRRLLTGACLGVLGATLPPLHADAAAWWEPVAFAGHDVTALHIAGTTLDVTVDGTRLESHDSGATFAPAPATGVTAPAVLVAGGIAWSIVAGRVLTGAGGGALHPDPRAPFLGGGAGLLAAPGAVPGLVVAVGSDGHVWRRTPDGAWTTALVLLPAGGLAGAPAVTGVQAFTAPLTPAVYLATAGEGVLLTDDGGADWIRTDGTGLPDTVNAIAASNATQSIYAATPDGLWMHHLQAFPQPPAYTDASLWVRWLGIAAVALAAVAAAVAVLRRLLPAAG